MESPSFKRPHPFTRGWWHVRECPCQQREAWAAFHLCPSSRAPHPRKAQPSSGGSPRLFSPVVGRVEVPRVLGRHWAPRLNALPLGLPDNMGLGAGGSPKGTRPISPLHLGGQKPLYPDLGLKASLTQLGFSFLRSLPCFAGPDRALRAPLCQNPSGIPVFFCLSVAP